MGAKTGIEWTDSTWNWFYGCSHKSPGCKNCYAEKMTARIAGSHDRYKKLTVLTKRGPKWSGKVELVPERLDQPLRWRDPRMVFVNSMSDMFHHEVPDEAVAATFAVMAAAKQHQFQLLTKRSDRMVEWFAKLKERFNDPYKILDYCEDSARQFGVETTMPGQWPVRNVWMGVSVEDAERKYRMDDLRQTPAVIRFVSAEPLLGDLGDLNLDKIHWVIVGGESGPGSRPMDIEWARNIRDQTRDADVAFFMKQWGQFDADGVKHRSKKETGCELDGVDWKQWPKVA